MDRVLKVVVVDDSAYVRKVVREILSRSPFVEVVGTARDGREALDVVERLDPDVVTCDLIMPELDGVGFVREQMQRRPVPIIIMSIANETAEAALTALDLGAIDFVQKPTALASEKIFEVSSELIEKVKAAGSIALNRISSSASSQNTETPAREPGPRIAGSHAVDMVVIGISTGGPQALKRLIPQLPADFPVPIAMVMHMPLGYTEMYAAKLNELSQLEVREAADGDEIKPGRVFLARAGRHLKLSRVANGKVITQLDAKPFDSLHRPAVDVLFQSAAEVYGSRLLGVVMTGMGSDGKQGAAWIKSQGGLVFTEAESSCVVYGMPSVVMEAGLSDRSVALDDMARAIREVV
ncbi:MAG TPA: chemotaxis response regulator protein-glutamate methylesterase [Pyrinomonadaceae bacterium]|nr:chemotaxis response regulator protein-glutamate methylesterase [Pyrinomonadaceae bacterium]